MKRETLSEDIKAGTTGNFYRSPDDKIMKLINVLNDNGKPPYDLFVQWYSPKGKATRKGRLYVGAHPYIKMHRFERLPVTKAKDLATLASS